MTQITTQDEAALATARARRRQDKKVPMLINIKDGRLLPNVPNMRTHKDYFPYTGKVSASKDERLAFIKTMAQGRGGRRLIVNTELPPFDLAKASKDDLMAFAATEFQLVLDKTQSLQAMRKAIVDANALREGIGEAEADTGDGGDGSGDDMS